jgi:colanic acid biosynthesis glycosyl transferase WcaI
MRILILNQYYPPDASNTARLLEVLAEDLARTHDVDVIAGRPSYNPGAEGRSSGRVRVRRVRSSTYSRSSLAGRALNYLSYLVLSLFAAVRSQRPDVIVAQTDPPVIGTIAALAAMRFRCRFVFVCHDVHPDIGMAMGLIRNRGLIAAWRAANGFIRRRAHRIVVVGRDMLEKLRQEGTDARKLVYVPTWGPDELVDPAVSARLRHENGWTDRFVVMHAGNIGLAQNIAVFPEIAEHLRSDESVLIVLLGDGAARPALERESAERGLHNLVVLPYRSPRDAHALMAAADLHVISLVPGLWGCATPSKTYAVMAMARPFVAAVDPGSEPALIADEFGCGVAVPAGDIQALVTAVRAQKEAPLDEMGAKGRRAFEARFSAASCVARLRAVIEGEVTNGA